MAQPNTLDIRKASRLRSRDLHSRAMRDLVQLVRERKERALHSGDFGFDLEAFQAWQHANRIPAEEAARLEAATEIEVTDLENANSFDIAVSCGDDHYETQPLLFVLVNCDADEKEVV